MSGRTTYQIGMYRKLANLYLGGKCVRCGSDKRLSIHHIDGDWKNNEPSNLVLLCPKCHKIAESGKLELKPTVFGYHGGEVRVPFGRKRRVFVGFRITEDEREQVKRWSKDMGVTSTEVWRRLLLTIRVLYDSNMTLSDALRINKKTIKIYQLLSDEGDVPLYMAIKPIPEMIDILRVKETWEALKDNNS